VILHLFREGFGPKFLWGTLSFHEKRQHLNFSTQVCLKNSSADVFQGPFDKLRAKALPKQIQNRLLKRILRIKAPTVAGAFIAPTI